MFVALLAILLQSTTINASLLVPEGTPTPPTARAVLLPLQYSKMFNAQAQERIDNYWEAFKNAGLAQRQKEQFPLYMAIAYVSALDATVAEMRRDSKINLSNLMKTATQGQVEFHGVPPGEYKLVITASVRGTDYAWTETLQVESSPIVLVMKNRVP
jgi:hypothetical protein